MDKKKKDPLQIALYAFLLAAILYFAAALGLCFDRTASESGTVNITAALAELETSLMDIGGIGAHITDTESYCFRLVALGGTGIAIYVLYVKTSKKRLHRKGVEHGSARWATEKEAKLLADKPPKEKTKSGVTCNNIILTQEVKMSLNTRQHRENLNVLVVGSSGSGKSRYYVKPNLMQLNTSYVVTDPKGDLLRSTGRLLLKKGYRIKVFNLINMEHSNNYNPFAYVYDTNGELNKPYVIKMINVLMKNTKAEGGGGGDQFWDDATKSLLSALAFYLLEKGDKKDCNFATMMSLLKLADVKEQQEDFESPLDMKFNELELEDTTSMAVSYYKDFKKAAGETAKSILISCAVRLQAFNLPEIADLTHTDNIELGTLGDKKTALFVIIPSSDSTFNFLAAMMYTQLFDVLYDKANFIHSGRLPVHVRCLLDEFANIGTIPDFDKLLATMRSMEISANIIIQNLTQLKAMYKDTWEVLTGNCDSLLFLGGQEASTLEVISKSLGKETIDVVSRNRTKGRSSSSSENNSILGRELMTTDELKVMKLDRCVLIIRALYPFFCHKYPIEKHPNYAYLEDSNPAYAYELSSLHTKKTALYNEADHYEPVADEEGITAGEEVNSGIASILAAAGVKEARTLMSDIEIPDDDADKGTEVVGEIITEDDIEESPERMYDEEVSDMTDHSLTDLDGFQIFDTSQPLVIDMDDEILEISELV